mmetsp:Transcript_41685/g.73180  ORF Transcript_41685/g.73180 Transcript_41685/m.73180 type:complete len:100 (+) Transcript_41685:93-392(+)
MSSSVAVQCSISAVASTSCPVVVWMWCLTLWQVLQALEQIVIYVRKGVFFCDVAVSNFGDFPMNVNTAILCIAVGLEFLNFDWEMPSELDAKRSVYEIE